MNWNKPFVARQNIYVSARVRQFLSRQSINQQLVLTGWLRVVQLYLDSPMRILIPGKPGIFLTDAICLLGKIAARAYVELVPVDGKIPCNVHVAFDDEVFSKIDWYEIHVEKR
jgi:hypothetical protein